MCLCSDAFLLLYCLALCPCPAYCVCVASAAACGSGITMCGSVFMSSSAPALCAALHYERPCVMSGSAPHNVRFCIYNKTGHSNNSPDYTSPIVPPSHRCYFVPTGNDFIWHNLSTTVDLCSVSFLHLSFTAWR